MSEAGWIIGVWNAAEGRELQMMERHHSVAARARAWRLLECHEEFEARRSAENLAEERKEATEMEQLRCLETAAKLAVENDSGLREQSEMRSVQASRGAEEE